MMREIKFRQPLFNNDDTFNSWHYWGWISEGNFVSPLSMGHNVHGVFGLQFTNLHDKNEKEIYEGDIVAYPVECNEHNKKYFNIKKDFITKTVVIYDEENACFDFQFEPTKKMHPLYQIVRAVDAEIEVIGNIYMNKDLLK
ncbi:MAG: YopX family protein [Clostridia bacterium]|jgi:uncharacterized phage protein (TIGR01671 family)